MNWSRRALLAATALVSTTSFARPPDPPQQPNIIFIFADDLGWGDVGWHGSAIRTPNLDQLAREGSEFEQFSVASPVCSPSRAAALTGQFPARLGVHRHFASIAHHRAFGMPDWLDPDVPTVADVLKGAGYATGHFGKWHLTNRGITDAPLPSAYGFDESKVFNGPGPQANTLSAYDDAIGFMRRNRGRPFFMNLWTHEPHLPHYPPVDRMAANASLGEQQQVYAAVVEGADHRIGKVLAELRSLGLEENTIVVFSSDNGPEVTGTRERNRVQRGDPDAAVDGTPLGSWFSVGETGGLRGRKRALYEGGVRVPFVVRWPGKIPAGRRDSSTVMSAVDLLPTFAAAAGAKLPNGYLGDGETMLAQWRGATRQRIKPLFWEWRVDTPGAPSLLAVREGHWKLVLPAGGKGALYNLLTDRAETLDIAPTQPALTARLTRMAHTWQSTLPTAPSPTTLSSARSTRSD